MKTFDDPFDYPEPFKPENCLKSSMKKDDVIRMAREAGIPYDPWPDSAYNKNIERFAALVAAAEREACAKVCEELRDDWLRGLGRYEFMGEGADYCADFIRARGQA